MFSLNKKLAVVIGGLVLALVFLAPPLTQGSEWDLLTYITVSHPFQVPGKVLEPNTKYVMKLLDLQGTRNVVQIFNEDRGEVLTTFIAASAYRLEPADKTVMTFIEVEPGYPKPVDKWFYPGRLNGLEFIYSKEQRQEIAAHAPGARANVQVAQNMPAEPSPEVEATPMPEEEIVTPAVPEEQTLKSETEVTREKPSEEQAATAEEQPATAETHEEELPKTAGELPLIGLIGLLCLGLGAGVKAFPAKS